MQWLWYRDQSSRQVMAKESTGGRVLAVVVDLPFEKKNGRADSDRPHQTNC